MTTNTTDLAAALNECMPLTIDDWEYFKCRPHPYDNKRVECEDADGMPTKLNADEIIGILWAECVRRGWPVAFHVDPPEVVVWPYRGNGRHKVEGNDALAFARAFAAAKRAEGGVS